MTTSNLLRVEPELHRDRKPEDIDLFQRVSEALAACGHQAPTNWTIDPELVNHHQSPPLLQRMAINSYWRMMLVMVPPEHAETSRNVRTFLHDSAEYSNQYYVELWYTVIAPAVVRLGL